MRKLAFLTFSLGLWAQSDSAIRRLDPAMDKLLAADAKVEKVAGGFQFTEGPVWMSDTSTLYFSDIPANAMMKWNAKDGVNAVYKDLFKGPFPPGASVGSNGIALDKKHLLYVAEHGNRRIARYEKTHVFTTLADRYEGKRLNSPNDLVFAKNGDLYFTDPAFGLRRDPPNPATDPKKELDFQGIYRIHQAKLELLGKLEAPNGLAFSPDEKLLYVANSNPKRWHVYNVKSDGTLDAGKVLYETSDATPGVPDGFRIDKSGNLWSSGPGGVNVISPAGKLLGVIPVPEVPANVAFGENDGKTLYITARTGLYRIRTLIEGIRP